MRYVKARIAKEHEDLAYRIYITDSLKTAYNLNMRFYDFIKKVPIETRSADEIVDHVKNKLKEI